ncbi:MAG: class I SAM-dependent methyltransferase [candidate division KSB1 bacterium]|nr:class I SAM-dependent methyltransferase [candidate division KSB1 bacterium]MDZ7367847.1 class I SAM-dependent methyltransferase [candidate division KSB1 bacterium]MDZ7405523.1 class I SAM-dependent methyltransferase [candidate division KSB1 bacterium]
MSCWRWKAPVYSLARRLPFFRRLLAAEQNNLVKLLQQFPPPTGVHLDLGSGTGDNLAILPGAAKRIAVDAEISMLRRNPASRRVVARAEALPFAAASFDFVSAIGLLEYIDDVEIFFREAKRVLQPNGSFLFTSSPPTWANHVRLVWGEKLYFCSEQKLKDFLQTSGWQILGRTRSWLQNQWLVAPAEIAYR